MKQIKERKLLTFNSKSVSEACSKINAFVDKYHINILNYSIDKTSDVYTVIVFYEIVLTDKE